MVAVASAVVLSLTGAGATLGVEPLTAGAARITVAGAAAGRSRRRRTRRAVAFLASLIRALTRGYEGVGRSRSRSR